MRTLAARRGDCQPARRQASQAAPGRLDRVQHAAHRDALPARLRRGDGLLRQLHDPLLGTAVDSAYYLKRTLMFGAVGLILMKFLAGRGGRLIRPLTPLLLLLAMAGLVAVLLPGIGVTVNGAKRWTRRRNSLHPQAHVTVIVNFFLAPAGKGKQRFIVWIANECVFQSVMISVLEHGARDSMPLDP